MAHGLSFRLIGFAAFIGLASSARLAVAEPARFVQDRLVIGFWVGPQDPDHAEQRYREIADARFTLAVGIPPSDVPVCDRFGLRALVDVGTKLDSIPDHPACWGALLTDEPGAGQFSELARRAREVRERHPGRFCYINLFPNYASAAQLGTDTYDEHVARFVREVQPEVLSMDHYPLMRPNSDSRGAYCDNLETLRVHSLRAKIPFWNYFYSMPFNDRLDPTEAQIRWQIFTSLAYGAKGVLYFCYWTPGKGAGGAGEFPKGGAILTAEGRKTRHYGEARRINAELQSWGPTLMGLTSTGVQRVKTGSGSGAVLQGAAVRKIERVGSDPESEFILGFFQGTNGGRAVLIVNHSHAFTAWPTISWDASERDIQEVDKTTGKLEPVVDDSPELKGLQLSFGPGDGRLFVMPGPKSP